MRDEPFLMDQEEVPLSINIGCAIPKEALPPAADILRDAEIAMHRAKDCGTDTYRFHDMALSAELATRRQMEGDLSDALAANEIELRYQPMIDATSQMVSGFEATLYWARRGHGPVPKDQLLSLAEASGHGTDLLSALLTTACRDARHWPEMTLVIGLSREQFFNQHLVALVSAALKETGLSPHLLEIEIGEDVLLDDLERALFQLDALREYRVRLGVSGFGARAGSILHLQRCAFDHMKLDKRLFSVANCRPETSSMLLHTIALADVLGTRCDAANVDTQGSADLLVEAGCKRLQDQLFGRPTTSARVLAMLRTRGLMSVETQTILPS